MTVCLPPLCVPVCVCVGVCLVCVLVFCSSLDMLSSGLSGLSGLCTLLAIAIGSCLPQWLLAIAFLDIPCFLDFLDILFSPLIFFVLSQSLLEVLTTD